MADGLCCGATPQRCSRREVIDEGYTRSASRFLRRRGARHRNRRARSAEIRSAGLCPPRDRAQQARRREPEGQRARILSRISPRFRRMRSPSSAPMASPRASRKRRRSVSSRCSTRPARWSPRCTIRASAMSRRAAGSSSSATPGIPEVEGTMGQISEPVTLVQTERDVDTLDIPHDTPVAYVTQTTLSVDDTRGIIAALHTQIHRHRRPGDARHLLRHAKPPDRGARAVDAGRCDPGGRRQEQLQLQPLARDRQRGRHSLLPHRRRQRGAAGMVQRRADRRHHRRRFGAGSAGRGCHRRAAPASVRSRFPN